MKHIQEKRRAGNEKRGFGKKRGRQIFNVPASNQNFSFDLSTVRTMRETFVISH